MEFSLLNLYRDILENGEDSMDRTSVGTRSVFGRQIRCHLKDGFPLLTTKRVPWKLVKAELLWFLEGSQDNNRLAELSGVVPNKTIWYPNYSASYWKGAGRPKFDGDLGPIYGVQWRRWNGKRTVSQETLVEKLLDRLGRPVYKIEKIDQLGDIIETLKTNPKSRRMVMSALNVGELDTMVLPPCHMFTQFHVNGRGELNQQVYIRSNDMFLGAPFNVASYALLQHMIAQVTGHPPGELIMVIGDAHIYHNHIDQVKEQLSREPFNLPKLYLNPRIANIDKFKMDDLEIRNYLSHPPIKAEMAA